jgi:low affinity Fe/Cu permease
MTGPESPNSSAILDDTEGGPAMFYIFTIAVLVVTGTVVLVALVNTWWILGAVVAFHLTVTAIVTAVIMKVMDGTAWVRSIASSDGRRDEAPATARRMATL